MLDQTSDGLKFFDIGVSQANRLGNPTNTFIFHNADGTTYTVATADPGCALVEGDVTQANAFRTPTLWNIENTAPYFHDNSARTLGDVIDHYRHVLGFPISNQDKSDLISFLKLL